MAQSDTVLPVAIVSLDSGVHGFRWIVFYPEHWLKLVQGNRILAYAVPWYYPALAVGQEILSHAQIDLAFAYSIDY